MNSVTNATGKLFYAGDIQRLPDGRFQPGVQEAVLPVFFAENCQYTGVYTT
ncbi:MAG: hypothetical protein VCF08_14360 [Alphaproteobacteria bacterium]